MRLFVALEIPAAVRENLAALVSDLRVLSSQLPDRHPRWVRPENIHLTLKFIGETDARKIEGIRAALSRIRTDAPVELLFRGLGFFPDAKPPRVFWAGVNASGNLPLLAANVDRALETQGIVREERAFRPHLTLARFDPPGVAEKLSAAVEQNVDHDFGSAQACEFHLIESNLHPSGAAYKTLDTFPFVTEP